MLAEISDGGIQLSLAMKNHLGNISVRKYNSYFSKQTSVFSSSNESKRSFVYQTNGTRFHPGHTHLTKKKRKKIGQCMGLFFS
jgi:hypothetical protein